MRDLLDPTFDHRLIRISEAPDGAIQMEGVLQVRGRVPHGLLGRKARGVPTARGSGGVSLGAAAAQAPLDGPCSQAEVGAPS